MALHAGAGGIIVVYCYEIYHPSQSPHPQHTLPTLPDSCMIPDGCLQQWLFKLVAGVIAQRHYLSRINAIWPACCRPACLDPAISW
jgi:hypothetical protein